MWTVYKQFETFSLGMQIKRDYHFLVLTLSLILAHVTQCFRFESYTNELATFYDSNHLRRGLTIVVAGILV